MSNLPPSEPTRPPAALAVPEEALPVSSPAADALPLGESVLHALGSHLDALPHVQLRDTDDATAADAAGRSLEPALPTGEAGRFRLEGEIARGGMGAILKGRDVDLGRDIAVKVLL